MATSVLLIGTGFVGGTVLNLLKSDERYKLSATARKQEQLDKLRSLGVNAIEASLDDSDKLTKAVFEHDVVINTASSDHPGSVNATLAGIQKRVDEGKRSIYIHTSGTGVLGDEADGMFASDQIFKDTDVEMIENIDDGAIHRCIDKKIARHAQKWRGKAEIRIMLPPLIYSKGSGPFKTISVQIPTLIRTSLKEGYAAMHGEGKPMWSHVDVNDLGTAYTTLLESLVKDGSPKAQAEFDVYVFAEQGTEHSWLEVSQKIGQVLHAKGKIASAEPKAVPRDELFKYGMQLDQSEWNGTMDYMTVGCNSRSRAIKLRELGWSPKFTTKQHFFDSIEHDVERIIKEE